MASHPDEPPDAEKLDVILLMAQLQAVAKKHARRRLRAKGVASDGNLDRDAENVAQEVIFKMMRASRDGSRNVWSEGYARRTVDTVVEDLRRAKHQEQEAMRVHRFRGGSFGERPPNPLHEAMASELREAILKRVSKRHGRWLVAHIDDGKTYAEIAAVEKVSESAVATAFHRMKKRIEDMIEAEAATHRALR